MVERYVRDVEVACSNHVTPTLGKRTVKLHEMWLYGFFIIKISDSFFWRSLEYDYFGTTPSEVTLTVLLRP